MIFSLPKEEEINVEITIKLKTFQITRIRNGPKSGKQQKRADQRENKLKYVKN